MDKLINNLKNTVSLAASDPRFIHHQWFVKYHLNLVEQIALEACKHYQNADRDLVKTLVWIHDYGKIKGVKDDLPKILFITEKLMLDIGFPQDFTQKAIDYLRIFESKMEMDLHTAPLEVQITSSADGASHLVGPFYYLWWLENPTRNFEDLMADNQKKAQKDWTKKVVLPEITQAFADRHKFIMENSGLIPESFLHYQQDK